MISVEGIRRSVKVMIFVASYGHYSTPNSIVHLLTSSISRVTQNFSHFADRVDKVGEREAQHGHGVQ